jgi:hypothetical protein
VYSFTTPQDLSQSIMRSSLKGNVTLAATSSAVAHAPDVSAEKAAILSAIADGSGDFQVQCAVYCFSAVALTICLLYSIWLSLLIHPQIFQCLMALHVSSSGHLVFLALF